MPVDLALRRDIDILSLLAGFWTPSRRSMFVLAQLLHRYIYLLAEIGLVHSLTMQLLLLGMFSFRTLSQLEPLRDSMHRLRPSGRISGFVAQDIIAIPTSIRTKEQASRVGGLKDGSLS